MFFLQRNDVNQRNEWSNYTDWPYEDHIPSNIEIGPFTAPTPAMPDDVKVPGNSLASYRKYYINNKSHLANWKKRQVPEWFNANV
jgi:hypothetical protein